MSIEMRTLRAFFILAAVAMFVGCGSGESDTTTPTKSDFTDGKADEEMPACGEYGLPDGCDICMEAGWYDDGACDDFCARADADCFSFEPETEPQVLLCSNKHLGGELLVQMANLDAEGNFLSEPWLDGERRDLHLSGTGDEGTYEDACVLDLEANQIVCDFGLDEEVRVDLEVLRDEQCSTLWESTDISFYLQGTFDGGLLSSEDEIRCSLAHYDQQNPC